MCVIANVFICACDCRSMHVSVVIEFISLSLAMFFTYRSQKLMFYCCWDNGTGSCEVEKCNTPWLFLRRVVT